MSWDFGLTERGDMSGDIVSRKDEVAQRVVNRLRRELGEWFLATNSGVPWYNEEEYGAQGLLGTPASQRESIDLVLRTVILGTEGVVSIKTISFVFLADVRKYNIYFSIVTDYGTIEQNIAVGA